MHRAALLRAWVALGIGLTIMMLWTAPVRAQGVPFAAVVMDARTGEILHSTNPTARLHPASLTKMMTLYVAFEAIRNGELSLDTQVRVSRRAASEPPSRLGLREGQRIQMRHLIRAAALRSGNDAATAIAEAVSGSVDAFAARMNRTAAALGMTQTSFRNAHGLTQSGHLSSARDMTILGRQLYFDYPEYYNIFSRRSEHAGVAEVRNTNSRFLDGYSGADGIKTGYTRAAGYNLTAMAERGGVRIIVTVFGGRSIQHRHDQIVSLMNRGFGAAPARAAVRRPARPDYRRPPAQVAAAPSGRESAGASSSRAAGRVIRLQTAPARSVFPARRPAPDAPVPAELLAAVQSGVASARADMAAPADDPDLPDEVAIAAAPRGAVARSLLPQGRPAAVLARASGAAEPVLAAAPDTSAAVEIAAAEAVGFSVIAPDDLAAITEAEPEAAPVVETAAAETPEAEAPAVELAEAETVVPDLPARARSAPAERPVTAIAAAPAEPTAEPAAEAETALAEADVPAEAVPTPGIALAAASAAPAAVPESQPVQLAAAGVSDLAPAPAAPEALAVTDEGQIVWRDQDLLRGLDEVVARLDEPGAIVLTASDEPLPPAPAPVMPEIVVRVSTSGGQVWAVDLGRFGSRFDAERTLLRVALAESASLGSGVRRVVESGGGFRGMIVSLAQDQAERACQRLEAEAQSCTVVEP